MVRAHRIALPTAPTNTSKPRPRPKRLVHCVTDGSRLYSMEEPTSDTKSSQGNVSQTPTLHTANHPKHSPHSARGKNKKQGHPKTTRDFDALKTLQSALIELGKNLKEVCLTHQLSPKEHVNYTKLARVAQSTESFLSAELDVHEITSFEKLFECLVSILRSPTTKTNKRNQKPSRLQVCFNLFPPLFEFAFIQLRSWVVSGSEVSNRQVRQFSGDGGDPDDCEKIRREWEKKIDELLNSIKDYLQQDCCSTTDKDLFDSFYPTLTKVLRLERVHPSLSRKVFDILEHSSTKHPKNKSLLCQDRVLGPNLLGQKLADAYDYGVTDRVLEMAFRLAHFIGNPTGVSASKVSDETKQQKALFESVIFSAARFGEQKQNLREQFQKLRVKSYYEDCIDLLHLFGTRSKSSFKALEVDKLFGNTVELVREANAEQNQPDAKYKGKVYFNQKTFVALPTQWTKSTEEDEEELTEHTFEFEWVSVKTISYNRTTGHIQFNLLQPPLLDGKPMDAQSRLHTVEMTTSNKYHETFLSILHQKDLIHLLRNAPEDTQEIETRNSRTESSGVLKRPRASVVISPVANPVSPIASNGPTPSKEEKAAEAIKFNEESDDNAQATPLGSESSSSSFGKIPALLIPNPRSKVVFPGHENEDLHSKPSTDDLSSPTISRAGTRVQSNARRADHLQAKKEAKATSVFEEISEQREIIGTTKTFQEKSQKNVVDTVAPSVQLDNSRSSRSRPNRNAVAKLPVTDKIQKEVAEHDMANEEASKAAAATRRTGKLKGKPEANPILLTKKPETKSKRGQGLKEVIEEPIDYLALCQDDLTEKHVHEEIPEIEAPPTSKKVTRRNPKRQSRASNKQNYKELDVDPDAAESSNLSNLTDIDSPETRDYEDMETLGQGEEQVEEEPQLLLHTPAAESSISIQNNEQGMEIEQAKKKASEERVKEQISTVESRQGKLAQIEMQPQPEEQVEVEQAAQKADENMVDETFDSMEVEQITQEKPEVLRRVLASPSILKEQVSNVNNSALDLEETTFVASDSDSEAAFNHFSKKKNVSFFPEHPNWKTISSARPTPTQSIAKRATRQNTTSKANSQIFNRGVRKTPRSILKIVDHPPERTYGSDPICERSAFERRTSRSMPFERSGRQDKLSDVSELLDELSNLVLNSLASKGEMLSSHHNTSRDQIQNLTLRYANALLEESRAILDVTRSYYLEAEVSSPSRNETRHPLLKKAQDYIRCTSDALEGIQEKMRGLGDSVNESSRSRRKRTRMG